MHGRLYISTRTRTLYMQPQSLLGVKHPCAQCSVQWWLVVGIDGLGLLTLEQYWPSPDLARGADQKLLRVLTSDVFALVRTYSCTPSVSQWLTRAYLSLQPINMYFTCILSMYYVFSRAGFSLVRSQTERLTLSVRCV